MTNDEATEVVKIVMAAFPVPRWGDDTIEAYAKGIERFDYATGTRAAELARDEEFSRPSIAQLRNHMKRLAPERKALPAPERLGSRPIPGIASTTVILGCYELEKRKLLQQPLVLSLRHERHAMNAQAIRLHHLAREGGKIGCRVGESQLRPALMELFATALEKQPGAFRCAWCQVAFEAVSSLTQYLDWLDSVHGESGEIAERMFCNGCAYEALRAFAAPVGPEDYLRD